RTTPPASAVAASAPLSSSSSAERSRRSMAGDYARERPWFTAAAMPSHGLVTVTPYDGTDATTRSYWAVAVTTACDGERLSCCHGAGAQPADLSQPVIISGGWRAPPW